MNVSSRQGTCKMCVLKCAFVVCRTGCWSGEIWSGWKRRWACTRESQRHWTADWCTLGIDDKLILISVLRSIVNCCNELVPFKIIYSEYPHFVDVEQLLSKHTERMLDIAVPASVCNCLALSARQLKNGSADLVYMIWRHAGLGVILGRKGWS